MNPDQFQPDASLHPRWEYLTLTLDIRNGVPTSIDLDEYGSDGWEMIAAVCHGTDLIHYFKRPRIEVAP